MKVTPVSQYDDQVRIRALRKAFQDRFGDLKASVVVRVPGRVNLIGEHIDYCGYGVHPMAIQQDTLVAVKTTTGSSKLRIANVNGADYPDPPSDCNLSDPIVINCGDSPKWWNYFLCGVKGVLEDGPSGDRQPAQGFAVMVDGRIPPSAGLSSSSALVVSAALSTLYAQGRLADMAPELLASLCAKSERFIGTQGGGMDQAIEILAKKGSAKLIEFGPLRSTDVTLPSGAKFVIANSTAECNKADINGGSKFNVRVVECRIAAKVLGKSMQVEEWRSISKLGDLQVAADKSIWEMMNVTKESLHEEPYTKDEVVKILELDTPHDLEELVGMVDDNVRSVTTFQLFKRAFHVYSEAKRVYDFKHVCDKVGEEGDSGRDALKCLGKLMYDSHDSCAKNYDCSHPALDQMVQLSNMYGALGARLTGAGWGGCIVALVPDESVPDYIEGLKSKYYSSNDSSQSGAQSMDQLIFPTEPGSGAQIFTLPSLE